MYRGSMKVSAVADKNNHTVAIEGTDDIVQLTTQCTGFGYRRHFLCPTCGRKCGKIHLFNMWIYCQRCLPLDLYKYRRGLYDEGGTDLIIYHMYKLAKSIGIKIVYPYRERKLAKEAGENVLDFPFCLIDYLDKKPPGMRFRKYLCILEDIQYLEKLRILAIVGRINPRGRDIRWILKNWREWEDEI